LWHHQFFPLDWLFMIRMVIVAGLGHAQSCTELAVRNHGNLFSSLSFSNGMMAHVFCFGSTPLLDIFLSLFCNSLVHL